MLRAFAHPPRSRLLAALRAYGSATSTRRAQRLSANGVATSYRLRNLGEVTSWAEKDFLDDLDDRSGADWLLSHTLRIESRWVGDRVAGRVSWSPAWRDAPDNSDFQLLLTDRKLGVLKRELHQVILRYRAAGLESGRDIQRVMVLLDSFPSPRGAV